MRDHLSVEIFRDVDSEADSAIGREGVELVNSFVKNMRVVRSNRALKLSQQGSDSVNLAKVRWPSFSADLNVILTDKTILSDSGNEQAGAVLGEAQTWTNGSRIATIDTAHSGASARFVVAHETAHLIGVTYQRLGERDDHCDIDECVMYPYSVKVTDPVLRPQRGFRAWRERQGYVKPEWDVQETMIQKSFCGNCIEQLAQRAFFLLMQKQGRTVPDTLL
jgi:hypothetical protein